jgi:hypothetical protein
MKKDQRKNLLERLAHSNEGKALEDYFQELISNMVDSRNYKSDEFEVEGKASVKAAVILKTIMRKLNLLKKEKKERQKNPYL